jgi:hypothetical protein
MHSAVAVVPLTLKADQDKDGLLGRNDSLQFFQRSGLPQLALANVWKQVNPQDAPTLGPTQFVLGTLDSYFSI